MKHLFLIFIVLVIGYAAFLYLDLEARQWFVTMFKRHILKFVAVLVALFMLFFFAVQHPSIQLF